MITDIVPYHLDDMAAYFSVRGDQYLSSKNIVTLNIGGVTK